MRWSKVEGVVVIRTIGGILIEIDLSRICYIQASSSAFAFYDDLGFFSSSDASLLTHNHRERARFLISISHVTIRILSA